MTNSSGVTTFNLEGFFIMEKQRHLFFFIFFLLYALILVINTLLIAVIYSERTLHDPMYIFVCNLSCNDLYGSTSLLPHLLSNLVIEVHTISLTNCLIQIFCLHTSHIIELNILAFMGYDRYVAVCHPLHYHTMMSARRLQTFIIFIWAYPVITFLIYESFTIRLTFCGDVFKKTHCANFELVKLSCTDTTIHSIIGLALIAVFIAPQFFTVLFFYVQILKVCMFASKDCRTKAFQTCTPHLLAVLNYFIGISFEVIQSRLNNSHLPYEFRTFMSLYFIIFPPLLNPIIYGVSSHVIRNHIRKLFFKNVVALKN